MKKITLIHTVKSIYNSFPSLLEEAFGEKIKMTNIVDEILISNTLEKGEFTSWNKKRLLDDMRVAEEEDSDLLVVTCSSLTPYVLDMAKEIKKPVVTIDSAMCRKAAETGESILVLATAATTVGPTVDRINMELDRLGKKAKVVSSLRTDAMDALKSGDVENHDRILSEESLKYKGADVVVLAQASMASAKEGVEREGDWTVLTSPESCIEEVKEFYGKN
ncbi:MAG: aspartate/glutamate racemase family protein [Spirochaetales bacterium]|nr:aspartate/glutamate racemase family protein [Spirochaetales bacterium]